MTSARTGTTDPAHGQMRNLQLARQRAMRALAAEQAARFRELYDAELIRVRGYRAGQRPPRSESAA